MSAPSVAIVILNWNGKSFLQQFLPSVVQTTYPNKRIILADNASTDDSVSFVKENYPQIEFILLSKNYGFAGGYNEALKQVHTDYYVLLNSDVEVTPHWLEPMVDLVKRQPAAAACQPKILAYRQKNFFEYAGAAGGWIDNYGYPFARGRVFDKCEQDVGQYNEEQKIFWASGAALFIRSDAFHSLQGFDASFFAHMEEIDLCWRLQLAGYEIYCCPSSVVYHVGGGTLPQGDSRKTFLNFRNNLMMLAKNLPDHERWKIPYRMLLDQVAAVKSLVAGDGGYFIAVFKSHVAFIRWLFTKKPKPVVKAVAPFRKLAGVYNGHIIFQFFLKKKKTFQEIIGEFFLKEETKNM